MHTCTCTTRNGVHSRECDSPHQAQEPYKGNVHVSGCMSCNLISKIVYVGGGCSALRDRVFITCGWPHYVITPLHAQTDCVQADAWHCMQQLRSSVSWSGDGGTCGGLCWMCVGATSIGILKLLYVWRLYMYNEVDVNEFSNSQIVISKRLFSKHRNIHPRWLKSLWLYVLWYFWRLI